MNMQERRDIIVKQLKLFDNKLVIKEEKRDEDIALTSKIKITEKFCLEIVIFYMEEIFADMSLFYSVSSYNETEIIYNGHSDRIDRDTISMYNDIDCDIFQNNLIDFEKYIKLLIGNLPRVIEFQKRAINGEDGCNQLYLLNKIIDNLFFIKRFFENIRLNEAKGLNFSFFTSTPKNKFLTLPTISTMIAKVMKLEDGYKLKLSVGHNNDVNFTFYKE